MTLANDPDGELPPRRPKPETAPGSSLDWAREAGIAKNVIREMDARVREKHRLRRGRRRIAAGSCALVLLVAAGAWSQFRSPPVAEIVRTTNAIVASPARQLLPDGSIVELNDGASIKVDYNDTHRRIVLERGEAHFQVAKHDGRPFIVAAGGVEARAIGTAFAVNFHRQTVEVLVTEGRVAVDRAAESSENTAVSVPRGLAATSLTIATLDAGNRVSVEIAPSASAASPLVLDVSAAEIADRLSWRVPRLEFSGTSLTEALALFNRYSAVRIVVADGQLGQLKLSGIVRADNTDTLLQLLHSELGFTEDRRTDAEIVLHRISAAPKSN